MKSYSKNKPYLAFEQEKARKVGDDWLVGEEHVRTLYNGRYCAVSGFFYAVVDGKYSVLAEKRGKGTPDFQGYWCCPCGFLEGDENSREGIKRETREECGVSVPYHKIKVVDVETEPEECNNGNVTIRHTAFLGKKKNDDWLELIGGEKDEVEEIKWIPISEIQNYLWAFNHESIIKRYACGRVVRGILELLYR